MFVSCLLLLWFRDSYGVLLLEAVSGISVYELDDDVSEFVDDIVEEKVFISQ